MRTPDPLRGPSTTTRTGRSGGRVASARPRDLREAFGLLFLLALLSMVAARHVEAQSTPSHSGAPTHAMPAAPGDDSPEHRCNHGDDEWASCPMHAATGAEDREGPAQAPGEEMHHGAGHGRMGTRGSEPGARPGHAMGGGDHGVMRTAMTLVHRHRDAIEREVEDIPNGVVTTTWSALDPQAARTLERHVVEMKAALEKGETVRGWDPLFAEIFQHYDEIEMVIEPIEGGVRVTETSDNPEVVKLIQAHARKVNDFLEHGPAAVHAETPLPEGYVDTRPQ